MSKLAAAYEQQLAEHADAIRAHGKRAVCEIVEIGARLMKAKDLCGRGPWLSWLEREFGWTEQTALNYMRINALARSSSKTVLNLELPMRALYLLAAPSTPEEARDSVIERAASGEQITYAKVKEVVQDARKADDEPEPEPEPVKSYSPPKRHAASPAHELAEAYINQILELFMRLTPANRGRVQDALDKIRQDETSEGGS